MERLHAVSILDLAHFVAGCLMMLAIWGAAFVVKGSAAHKSAGRVFAILCALVAVTSIPRIVVVFQRGDLSRGLAFSLLALIAVTLLTQGVLAIRLKHKPGTYFDSDIRLVLSYCLGVGGALGLLYCYVYPISPLLLVMSMLAVALDARVLLGRGKTKVDPLWWKREHAYSMIALAVFAHVGLVLIIGFMIDRKIGDGLLALMFLPLIAVTIAVVMRVRKKYFILN